MSPDFLRYNVLKFSDICSFNSPNPTQSLKFFPNSYNNRGIALERTVGPQHKLEFLHVHFFNNGQKFTYFLHHVSFLYQLSFTINIVDKTFPRKR